MDIQRATVNTAGAYISVNGLYPFAIGSRPHQGHIPVIRLGGHREQHETGWQCAAREVYEEAGLQVRPVVPQTTFFCDGDNVEADLEEIQWWHETDHEHVPLLVVAYRREGEILLSVMYLAQADGVPTPCSEIKGLLLLEVEDIWRLCREPTTLEQYLESGGKAILTGEFDRSLVLEPFVQLRLLSKILTAQTKNSVVGTESGVSLLSERQAQVERVLIGVTLPDGIRIRAWAEADFAAIEQLSTAEGWPTPRNRSDEAKAAYLASWPALVATYEERVIGFLRALTDGQVTTYVAEILIAPEWRGKRLGHDLLDVCHRLCPSTRLDLLATELSGGFYEAMGFRPFQGFRKSYR